MKKEALDKKEIVLQLPIKELQGNGICNYSSEIDFNKFLKEIQL